MIIKFSQLARLRKSLNGKKIVFAGGTFDLFHRGHIESFKNMRRYGDVVIVSVSSDKRVNQRKGPKRPILPQKERLALVDSIRYVDYTILAPVPSTKHPFPTMRILDALRPDIFITIDKKWLNFEKNIKNLNVNLLIIQRGNINSTTRIIKKILKRYCSDTIV